MVKDIYKKSRNHFWMIEGASIKISNPDSMGVYKLEKFKLWPRMKNLTLKTKILDRFQKLRVLPNRLYVSFNSSKNILTFLIFYIWIVRKKYFYDDFISGRRGGLKETHFKSKNASGQRRNSSWTNDRIRNNFNPKKFLRTQPIIIIIVNIFNLIIIL